MATEEITVPKDWQEIEITGWGKNGPGYLPKMNFETNGKTNATIDGGTLRLTPRADTDPQTLQEILKIIMDVHGGLKVAII